MVYYKGYKSETTMEVLDHVSHTIRPSRLLALLGLLAALLFWLPRALRRRTMTKRWTAWAGCRTWR